MIFKVLISKNAAFWTRVRYNIKKATNSREKMVIALMDVALSLLFIAGAQHSDLNACIYRQTEMINPQYKADLNSVPSSEVQSFDTKPEATTKPARWKCDTKDDLLFYVREQMLSRTTDFSVIYQDASNEDVLTVDTFKALMDEIFAYDDPDIFTDYDYLRLSWTRADLKIIAYTDYIIYEFSFRYLTTKDEETKLNMEVQEILSSLDADQLTDSEKIKAVNDYIIKNISFDTTNRNKSAYLAVTKGSTICRGYALLSYLLLNELSIPVRIITGEGHGKPHAWEIVKIGDSWYNLDIAWNDITFSDSFYLKNNGDFYFHDRDALFRSKSFRQEYPMALESYRAK